MALFTNGARSSSHGEKNWAILCTVIMCRYEEVSVLADVIHVYWKKSMHQLRKWELSMAACITGVWLESLKSPVCVLVVPPELLRQMIPHRLIVHSFLNLAFVLESWRRCVICSRQGPCLAFYKNSVHVFRKENLACMKYLMKSICKNFLGMSVIFATNLMTVIN